MNNKTFWVFASEHPFITLIVIKALIDAPADILRALKWDGHKPNNIYNCQMKKEGEALND